MSMSSTRPLLLFMQFAIVVLSVTFNQLSTGQPSPKTATYNESITEDEFVVSHSIPWQVRRKFVKVIQTQTKGQIGQEKIRRQHHQSFKPINSSFNKENAQDFINFDDDFEPQTNELEYMLVQESNPMVGVSHMPVVEIMTERPLFNRRPSSRAVDHPVFMPVDVVPALNLQIDTLGVGGNFNGQTNLRIQSSTPALSTLFDIIPNDALSKSIPMEVKTSSKQLLSLPQSPRPSKESTSTLPTSYSNFASHTSTSNYPTSPETGFTEVKKVKRKKNTRKYRTKAIPISGHQFHSDIEEQIHPIGTQSSTNQEITDGQGESDFSQNPSKGHYQSHHQTHQFQYQQQQQQQQQLHQQQQQQQHQQQQLSDIPIQRGHGHQPTYDSVSHTVRRLERKNNQFDHSPDPGTDSRFNYINGDSGLVTSNVGTISDGGIKKTRTRIASARITGPQIEVDDQGELYDFHHHQHHNHPPSTASSFTPHNKNSYNPPVIMNHHHHQPQQQQQHSEEDNSDEFVLKYMKQQPQQQPSQLLPPPPPPPPPPLPPLPQQQQQLPSHHVQGNRNYNRHRYESHNLRPTNRDIRSSASSSMDSNHGSDNGFNSFNDEDDGESFEQAPKPEDPPPMIKKQNIKPKSPEVHVNLIPKHIHSGLWNYEDEDKWGRRFPSCEGMAQSPINIEANSISDDSNLSVELMPSYGSKISVASIVNTGLTLEILHVNGPRPTITGSAVYEDVFAFHKLHFHWGSKNSIGSEHAIFDQKFPMEMHIVHYNDKYDSVEKAITKPDGLCVIAVFFQVTKQDNPRFDSLMKSLKRVSCGGNSVPFNGLLNLTNFLPSNHNEFYRYQGSLTTPPCTESVVWLILKHGLLIGKNQLKKFRELKQYDCSTPIMNNWRNIQSVNGRRVDRAIVSFVASQVHIETVYLP